MKDLGYFLFIYFFNLPITCSFTYHGTLFHYKIFYTLLNISNSILSCHFGFLKIVVLKWVPEI